MIEDERTEIFKANLFEHIIYTFCKFFELKPHEEELNRLNILLNEIYNHEKVNGMKNDA